VWHGKRGILSFLLLLLGLGVGVIGFLYFFSLSFFSFSHFPRLVFLLSFFFFFFPFPLFALFRYLNRPCIIQYGEYARRLGWVGLVVFAFLHFDGCFSWVVVLVMYTYQGSNSLGEVAVTLVVGAISCCWRAMLSLVVGGGGSSGGSGVDDGWWGWWLFSSSSVVRVVLSMLFVVYIDIWNRNRGAGESGVRYLGSGIGLPGYDFKGVLVGMFWGWMGRDPVCVPLMVVFRLVGFVRLCVFGVWGW
jgi:hypothetical protein